MINKRREGYVEEHNLVGPWKKLCRICRQSLQSKRLNALNIFISPLHSSHEPHIRFHNSDHHINLPLIPRCIHQNIVHRQLEPRNPFHHPNTRERMPLSPPPLNPQEPRVAYSCPANAGRDCTCPRWEGWQCACCLASEILCQGYKERVVMPLEQTRLISMRSLSWTAFPRALKRVISFFRIVSSGNCVSWRWRTGCGPILGLDPRR